MSYEQHTDYGYQGAPSDGYNMQDRHAPREERHYREEVYSKRVPAGKRTYFFDVKPTRSGDDYFITITESKRIDDHRYEKHKIFLYKEDFGKFIAAIHEVVQHIREEYLPDYDFKDLPELPLAPRRSQGDEATG